MVVFIIALIMLAISIFSPWYNVQGDFDGEMRGTSSGFAIIADVEMKFDLNLYFEETEMDMDMKASAMGQSFSDSQTTSSDHNDEHIEASMDTTYYLTIISTILALVCVIIAGLAAFGVISTKIGLLTMVIAMVFILIVMIYFPVDFPSAMKQSLDESDSQQELQMTGLDYDGSFIGSSSSKIDMIDFIPDAEGLDEAPMDAKWSWGPAYGWYLIIGSFVMALIGVIFMAVAGKVSSRPYKPRPTLAYQEPTPRSYPPPPQPTQPDYYNEQPSDRFYHDR
jgi:hypothetical protein